jgi:hypothetical protein
MSRFRLTLAVVLPGLLVSALIWLVGSTVVGLDGKRASTWAIVLGLPAYFIAAAIAGRRATVRDRRQVYVSMMGLVALWLWFVPAAFRSLPEIVGWTLYAAGALVLVAGIVLSFRQLVSADDR